MQFEIIINYDQYTVLTLQLDKFNLSKNYIFEKEMSFCDKVKIFKSLYLFNP